MASRLRRRLRRAAMLAVNVGKAAAFAGGYPAMVRIVLDLLRARGMAAAAGWAMTAVSHGRHRSARHYRRWLLRRAPRPPLQERLLVIANSLGGTDGCFIEALLRRSRELSPNVDVVLVTDPAGAGRLEQAGQASRVCVVARPGLSVAAVLREALRRGGDYPHTALLGANCIPGELAALPDGGDRLLCYGDEDVIDAEGERSTPFFKPDYSPDLLAASHYFGSCLVVSQALLRAVPAPSGEAQDFEDGFHGVALKFAECADRVERIDAILAHRVAGAPGGDGAMPAYLPTFLAGRYPGASAQALPKARPPWRCRYGNRAEVSVIVPTRDRLDLLRPCIEDVFRANQGADFEVLVVDNGSVDDRTLAWFDEARATWERFRVVAAPGGFNWSRLNNLGMAEAVGDVFVFLNNDTRDGSGQWLARLADVALRPDVGLVGALLLYPSGRIQHAGVVVGYGGQADHVYRGVLPCGEPGEGRSGPGEEADEAHMFISPLLPRNVAAVTGACMAMARRTAKAIGVFDEGYRVAGSDVEMCIRALAAGYLNVYLPDVRLTHLESQSRGGHSPPADAERLARALAEHCPVDPFYNPNLSLESLYPSYALD